MWYRPPLHADGHGNISLNCGFETNVLHLCIPDHCSPEESVLAEQNWQVAAVSFGHPAVLLLEVHCTFRLAGRPAATLLGSERLVKMQSGLWHLEYFFFPRVVFCHFEGFFLPRCLFRSSIFPWIYFIKMLVNIYCSGCFCFSRLSREQPGFEHVCCS